MSTNETTCKNCDSQYDAKFAFCPYCGQKSDDKLTLGVLFYNTISNYFSFDARFFKSFIPLMLRPGFLAKEFVGGKRLQYLHPAQYYLFVSVIFFFILSFKVREYNNVADKAIKKGFELEKNINFNKERLIDSLQVTQLSDSIINNENIVVGLDKEKRKELDSTLKAKIADPTKNNINFGYNTKKLDSLIAVGASEEEQLKSIGLKEDSNFIQRAFIKQVLKFHKQEGGGIVRAIFDTIPIALFFLLPIFAFILKLFYWRRGSFSYHLVFSFYYFSFLFIVLGLLIGLNYLLDIPGWIEFLIVMSTFVYLWLSMKHFYKQGYFVTLIKSSVASFIYMMLILPFAVGIIIATSFFLY